MKNVFFPTKPQLSNLSNGDKKFWYINAQALHPGSCKQSVLPALAIFDETTSTALLSYFRDRLDAAQFLGLIHTWWIIFNSKARYLHNRLGNPAVPNYQKPQFLRAFAHWLAEWKSSAIPNFEKFQFSKQTSDAMIQTLRCHESLIEDLLNSGSYKFVCIVKFQSDPIERRFSQYRQMSGGCFLVALKEVKSSEKNIENESLVEVKM